MVVERTVPAGVEREVNREESAENLLVFLTITHPSIADAIRVVSNDIDMVLGSKTFTGYRFTISVLSDTESAPGAQLQIQNVDRSIGNALLAMSDPASLKLEVIAASEFDLTVVPHTETGTATVTYTADQLHLVGVEADAMFIKGRLETRDYAKESWPGPMATQDAFPGLFR